MADHVQYCVYCGTKLTDGSSVCPYCGRDNSVPKLGARKSVYSEPYRKGMRADIPSEDEYADPEEEEVYGDYPEDGVYDDDPDYPREEEAVYYEDPEQVIEEREIPVKKKKKRTPEKAAGKNKKSRKSRKERGESSRTKDRQNRKKRDRIQEEDSEEESGKKGSGIFSVLVMAAVPVVLLCVLIPLIAMRLPDPSLGGLPFFSSREEKKDGMTVVTGLGEASDHGKYKFNYTEKYRVKDNIFKAANWEKLK